MSPKFLFILTIVIQFYVTCYGLTEKETAYYREMAKKMFYHAYDGYMKYAFPYDELRPISCDGHDTWGSYSLTLIDALDTLAIMGNSSEFRKVAAIVLERADFGSDINVSVFETNIRIVGGLISAHLMSRRMGMELDPGWPCTGPLLRLAEVVAKKLLPAFHTKTGMPYGTVNLAHGVPYGETPITCTAGVGTYLVEFGALSRLTGDPIYEEAALRAMLAAWRQRSALDLLGNHIDVNTGRWTALDAGIGAGVDSYFEYLVKGAALLQRPELMQMFNSARVAIDRHLRHDDWHLWVTMTRGHVTMPLFQSLEAFWPGVLTLAGDVDSALKTLYNYHQVWRQYGFTPESYNIPQSEASNKREGYPLRPELVESLMYLFRATGDRSLLSMGADVITSIEHSTKTSCGYATVKNVRNHQLENRMESFFLAETTKYLYLLFAEDHWMHNTGGSGTLWRTERNTCVLDAGGYVFNSEAHPVDPGALWCCTPPGETMWQPMPPQQLADLILNPELPRARQKEGQVENNKEEIKEEIEQTNRREEQQEKAKCQKEEKKQSNVEDPQYNKEVQTNEGKTALHENADEDEPQESNISTEQQEESTSSEQTKSEVKELLDVEQSADDSVPSASADDSDSGVASDAQVKLDAVKQRIEDAVNEFYQKNRDIHQYILDLKTKSDNKPVEKHIAFDSTYDEDGLTKSEADKILTLPKVLISEDTQELEPDSNLTADIDAKPIKATSSALDSSLNLPRFGAITGGSGDNASERGPGMEAAPASPSVSSSKYASVPGRGTGTVEAAAAQHVSLDTADTQDSSLQEAVGRDLEEYYNFTSSASHGLLSCPHPPYASLLSFQGQLVEV